MWSHPFLLGKEGKKVREKSRWKLSWFKEGKWRRQGGGMEGRGTEEGRQEGERNEKDSSRERTKKRLGRARQA